MTLTATSFDWVRALVHKESAIVLQPGKEYLVEARLLPIARQLGIARRRRVRRVGAPRPDPDKTRRIVEALTTNETSWFRDGDPFTALTSTVMPALLAARGPNERLQIWSAACSSGQEPYTIAMLLEDSLPNAAAGSRSPRPTCRGRWSRGRRPAGSASSRSTAACPRPCSSGTSRGRAPSGRSPRTLRRMVTASECNLAAPLPRMGPFDVVYLRNVLIYFDLPTKQVILRRVRELMRPDGWLFLGAAETTLGVDDSWERVVVGRSSAYRPLKGT